MKAIIIIVCFISGLFGAISPESAWHISEGWKFKNAEPSDTAIIMTRIGGVLAIVFAVVLVFVEF